MHGVTGARVQALPRSLDVSGADEVQLRLWAWFGILVVAGALLTVINVDLPIIRNAFSYAKAALSIVENDFDVIAVVWDRAWTFEKPLLFSALSSPLVWLLGGNAGIVVPSALGTVFFLWTAALVIRRLNGSAGSERTLAPLELVFVVFNPLVFYQFWSGYPDSLFAGLVLLAFLLTDTIATQPERDTRWHIVGLGITIFLAIHTKLYGAVLGIVCPLYLIMHWRQLVSRSSHAVWKLCIFGAAFSVLAAVLLLAKLQMNPLLHLTAGAGFDSYVEGAGERRWQSLMESLCMLGFALLLIFHVSLPFMFAPAAWRTWKLPWTVFIAIFLVGLLMFGGTSYNMRYFLPVLPFVAIPIATGLHAMGTKAFRTVLGLYGAVALVLVLNFNVVPVHQWLQPLTGGLLARHEWLEAWLNNLRIAAQLDLKSLIDKVNAQIPAGSVLYWSSSYYHDATHGLGHHLGIKNSIDLRYVMSPREIEADVGESILVMQPVGGKKLRYPPAWATVEQLGPGLFRLAPFFIKCGPLSGDAVAEGLLHANAIIGDRQHVAEVEFLDGDKVVGADSTPPFELSWLVEADGRHEIRARGKDGEGKPIATSSTVCYAGAAAREYQVGTMWDLAREEPSGAIKYGYRSLQMSDRMSTAGVRLGPLNVPRGARLSTAYLDFSVAAPGLQPAILEIGVELTGDARKFEPRKNNLSARIRSTEIVKWESAAWAETGKRQRSPNLAPILERVFAQPDWKPGNAVVLTPALPLIAELIRDWASDTYLQSLSSIPYIGNVCLVLELDRPLSTTYWLNVNDPNFPFVGVIEHTSFQPRERYGGRHIVYLSKYLPHSDRLYSLGADEFLDYALPFLQTMFPQIRRDWILARHLWRARWAQPVVELNYSERVPSGDGPIEGFHICTMAQIYPEDRGTNYAIREGRKLGQRIATAMDTGSLQVDTNDVSLSRQQG